MTVAAVWGDTFRSLRVRNFRLFFIGQFISQSGTWMTMIAQTLLLLDMTGSGVMLGILAACQFGPVLILGAWAGALADRVDKRRLLFLTQAGAMIQSLVFGLVVADGQRHGGADSSAGHGPGNARLPSTTRSPVVRHRDGSDRARRQRRQPQQRHHDRFPGGGPGPGRSADRCLRLRLVFLHRQLQLHRGPGRSRHDEKDRTVPVSLEPREPEARSGPAFATSVANQDLFVPMVMMAIIGTLAFNFSVSTPLLITGALGGSEQAFTLFFSCMSFGALMVAFGHRPSPADPAKPPGRLGRGVRRRDVRAGGQPRPCG